MVRHSIETCYTAQKLSNWENPDKQPVSLNLLGGQSTDSLEKLRSSCMCVCNLWSQSGDTAEVNCTTHAQHDTHRPT